MAQPSPPWRRFIQIDYSGAAESTTRLPGLRVYLATLAGEPVEVRPDSTHLARHWTRQEVAEWLLARLREPIPTFVGIDHALSFPLAYFERYQLPLDWPAFLQDFVAHWPVDRPGVTVESIRRQGTTRSGETRWRRIAERRDGRAKSVFHFDVPGSVAKSTHAGLPWILTLRRQLGPALHCWPFDGWSPPPGRSAIAEVYPSRMRLSPTPAGLTQDQFDAWSVAEWLRRRALAGSLLDALAPTLSPVEHAQAVVEGWILGVD
ncbi:MAG: hypothetical protein ACOYNR_16280 [Blastocatellia bacterium]